MDTRSSRPFPAANYTLSADAPGIRIGIDVGGTFIDFVLEGADGLLHTHKVLASPADLVPGILAGLEKLLDRAGVSGGSVTEVIHATTLGSNAVLERRGPRVALLTTRGFRDMLQIQRSLRFSMYDVQIEKAKPLVPRSLVWEVTERMSADGTALTPLDETEVVSIARELRDRGVEAVAVSYLHAYAAPDHERRTRRILASEVPEIAVTISSDVSLQGREYERTNTAIVNAYLSPVLGAYLVELEEALPRIGIRAPLWIMQSSGGLTPAGRAAAMPVRTIESGPAAGALMSAHQGKLAGTSDVISLDMGGTTAKAAVIRGGRPATARYFELERVELRKGSGLPLDIPAIDLVEIGIGGGSIAETRHGVLQVGPRSAGADPGPVCYSRGGDQPTVTDANLLLGYLNPEYFAGGALRLDRAASERAVRRLADELGIEPLRTAWGIHELANFEMEKAIRLVSIDRGLDPRDFALICIGGAAPAHASRLARSLGVDRLIVPPGAGVGSAVGLLKASESFELAQTALMRLDKPRASDQIASIFADLETEARDVVGQAWDDGSMTVTRTAGLRYAGQGYELEVALDQREGDGAVATLLDTFQHQYERAYGYRETLPVEGVTWYVTLMRLAAHESTRPANQEADRRTVGGATRPAYFPELGTTDVRVIDRPTLQPGDTVSGPALVEEAHTTTVVQPGDSVHVDGTGALVIQIGGDGGS